MILLSLLPVGLMQTRASVEHGTWYARSAELMQTPTMDTLRWLASGWRHALRHRTGGLWAGSSPAFKTGWSITKEEDPVSRQQHPHEDPMDQVAVR